MMRIAKPRHITSVDSRLRSVVQKRSDGQLAHATRCCVGTSSDLCGARTSVILVGLAATEVDSLPSGKKVSGDKPHQDESNHTCWMPNLCFTYSHRALHI